jgi:hypothetical protein
MLWIAWFMFWCFAFKKLLYVLWLILRIWTTQSHRQVERNLPPDLHRVIYLFLTRSLSWVISSFFLTPLQNLMGVFNILPWVPPVYNKHRNIEKMESEKKHWDVRLYLGGPPLRPAPSYWEPDRWPDLTGLPCFGHRHPPVTGKLSHLARCSP